MIAIRTICTHCGADESYKPEEIRLVLEVDGEAGLYQTTCAWCGTEFAKPASHRVVTLLLACGVTYGFAESQDSPLTEADIVEFARQLDDPHAWRAELGLT